MKEYKYRHEIKFSIGKSDANVLKRKLEKILNIDENAANKKDNSYKIKSLYFDNLNSDSYYEKIDGVAYRKKYRIRTYNDNNNVIRLEKKIKHNNLTAKEGCLISKEIYSKIIEGKIHDIETEEELLKEFIIESKLKNLLPAVIVEYKRIAYTYPISDVRITIDFDLKSGRYHYDLLEDGPSYDVFDPKKVIIEVKYNDILPSHIADILASVPICRQAISKFSICRSIK